MEEIGIYLGFYGITSLKEYFWGASYIENYNVTSI
jgi:hypothetical protein